MVTCRPGDGAYWRHCRTRSGSASKKPDGEVLARTVGEGPLATPDVDGSAPTGKTVDHGRALQGNPVIHGATRDAGYGEYDAGFDCWDSSRNGIVEALEKLLRKSVIRKWHGQE